MEDAENPTKSRQNNLNIMNKGIFNFNIDQLADNGEQTLLSKNSYVDKSIQDEYVDSNLTNIFKKLIPTVFVNNENMSIEISKD